MLRQFVRAEFDKNQIQSCNYPRLFPHDYPMNDENESSREEAIRLALRVRAAANAENAGLNSGCILKNLR